MFETHWKPTLYLKQVQHPLVLGSPGCRALKDARRRLISRLPKLRWIDERPVTAIERAGCEAWAEGGKEAEMQAAKGRAKKKPPVVGVLCEPKRGGATQKKVMVIK